MNRFISFIFLMIAAAAAYVASGQTPSSISSQPDQKFPCEFMKAAIDASIIENSELKDVHLVFLFRPGLKETSYKLLRKRMRTLRIYLDNRRFTQDNIIMATGEARNEYGSVEIYSKGKLTYRVYLRHKDNLNFVC